MTRLALSDEILMSVEKPARYIGNEINIVRKDPDEVEIGSRIIVQPVLYVFSGCI